MTEADTCREFVTPRLVEAGWGAAESVIGEQHSFTNGRIIVAGGKVRRGKQRRADYLLYYRRDFPLAVVEAKELGLPAETGVQQARDYAEMLGLKFAYATNGHRIIEIDYTAGTEREVNRYATPHELWQRLTASAHLTEPAAAHLLEPFNLVSGKVPRYYQHIAIQRVIESILLGHPPGPDCTSIGAVRFARADVEEAARGPHRRVGHAATRGTAHPAGHRKTGR